MTNTERNTLIELIAKQINRWLKTQNLVDELSPEDEDYETIAKWADQHLTTLSGMQKLARSVGITELECHGRAMELRDEAEEVA